MIRQVFSATQIRSAAMHVAFCKAGPQRK